jgi:phage baseplate assembly protein V
VLKVGRVSKQNPEAGTVTVVFGADDALASWSLPVLQPKTLGDKVYWMPDVGEFVACLMDEHAEFGVVLGAMYSQAEAPPLASLDKLHIAFKDGTTVEYDRAAHALSIAIAESGTVAVSAGAVTLSVPEGGQVVLGGSGAEQLVRKSYVDERFDLHVHPGVGTPPTPVAPLPGWFTTRTVAE